MNYSSRSTYFKLCAGCRVLVSGCLFAAAGSLSAQTIWTAGTGDWNTPGNWTLGVPNSASGTTFDAQIKNGGTAQLSAPGASVRRMRVGVFAGGGHLEVNGGGLTVTEDLILNFEGSGVATTTVQLGGIVTVPATVVGYSGAGESRFLITGAGSRVNATTSFVVGRAGSAVLTLTDGGALAVGNGTLPLQVGTLPSNYVSYLVIGNGGAAGVLQASEGAARSRKWQPAIRSHRRSHVCHADYWHRQRTQVGPRHDDAFRYELLQRHHRRR
ncbi:MAG: hypothetical protein WD851_04975 [Pirellulales bacterium]